MRSQRHSAPAGRRESGIALITTLLILMLMSALLAGFALLVMSDARLSGSDRDYRRSYYGAHAGMEKITADLGNLFAGNFSPSTAQLNNLENSAPSIPGISFVSPGGASGYDISFPLNASGQPDAKNRTILSGPFEGFVGLVTPYTVTVTARTINGSEVRLQRTLQTVAIPVFQFGIFSETDLSFFPGPVFNFGGRVHTNGNLFLAAGSTLTLSDRVTSFREVYRSHLSNGWSTGSGYTGTVNVITSPGVYRALGLAEGSRVFTTQVINPAWPNLSISTYNGNIRNGLTGAKQLVLPLVSAGAAPVDLIRRPDPNEDTLNPGLLSQRFFTSNTSGGEITSLRILISDDGNEITNLPSVTATQPIFLGNDPAGRADATGVPAGCRLKPGGFAPKLAESAGTTNYWTKTDSSLIGGCIKIEYMDAAGNWNDVTEEILNYGVTGRNLNPAGTWPPAAQLAPNPSGCAHPNANAILRFQHVKDVPVTGAPCGVTSNNAQDFWPNVLHDAREGNLRDNISTAVLTMFRGGIMHYVELDIANLNRWFMGTLAGNGLQAARNNNGLVVYFSDRRGNRVDPTAGINKKIGEYGFEDFVNPLSSSGTPNNSLDTGEDVNGDGIQQTYGIQPSAAVLAALRTSGTVPPSGYPTTASRPWSTITFGEARVNPPLFFRRALKLTNGTTISLGTCTSGANCGLTIASENPVYVSGDYNTPGGSFLGAHGASSVIADAVTLLSRNWNDANSFTQPHAIGGGRHNAATTWYRLAIVSGKGPLFPQPAGTAQDFGTDGGTHNFLRYIENWGGQTLNYRGSIVSFYYARQAIGTYKCCTNVYSPPTRGYNFDVEFLQPNLLPPRTPLFRDVNITGFSQIITPTM